jgi:hypothetical protein
MARRFRVFACSALGMFSVLTPSMSDTLFQGSFHRLHNRNIFTCPAGIAS